MTKQILAFLFCFTRIESKTLRRFYKAPGFKGWM